MRLWRSNEKEEMEVFKLKKVKESERKEEMVDVGSEVRTRKRREVRMVVRLCRRWRSRRRRWRRCAWEAGNSRSEFRQ